jgi:hypothetical protein
MMAKIHGARARMVEVPVHHYPRAAGTSQFFKPRRILKLALGLMAVWFELVLLGGKRRYEAVFASARPHGTRDMNRRALS